MALEAQEVVVRVRMTGGVQAKQEADRVVAGLDEIRGAQKELNVSSDENLASSGFLGFTDKAGKNLDSLKGKLDSFSKDALQVGRTTAAVSAVSAAGIYESVKTYTKANSQFKLLETQAGAHRKERAELEGSIGRFAKFGIGPKELAESLYGTQSVFHNVTADIKATEAAAMGAAVGHDTLKNSSEALVSLWKDGAVGVHSYAEEMALLDRTVGQGKMHLPELTEVSKTGLFQTTGSLNINQRGVLATLASVSQGLSEGGTQSAATRFRTAILKMFGLKGEALADAKKLGLEQNTLADTLREGPEGMIKALQDLNKAKASLGEDEWDKAIAGMFGGSRSAGTIFTALTALKANEEILRTQGVHGTKTLVEHFKQASETPEYQLKVAKSHLEDVGYDLGKAFTPAVVDAVKIISGGLGDMLKVFQALPGPVQDTLGVFVVLTAALSPVAFLLGGAARALSIFLTPLQYGGGLVMDFVRALKGLGPEVEAQMSLLGGETAGAEAAGGELGAAMAVGLGEALLAGLAAYGLIKLLKMLGFGKHEFPTRAENLKHGKLERGEGGGALGPTGVRNPLAPTSVYGGTHATEHGPIVGVGGGTHAAEHTVLTGIGGRAGAGGAPTRLEEANVIHTQGTHESANERVNRALAGKVKVYVQIDGKTIAETVNRVNREGEARR